MEKSIVLCADLCIALVFTGCGSSESAYKKTYEEVKVQGSVQASAQTEAPMITPLTPAPVTQTQVVDNVDNATVRAKDMTVMSDSSLNAFDVVIGSFGLKTSAEGLQHTLQSAGYGARAAYDSARDMYRAVTTTHTDKALAVAPHSQLHLKYPDAWLLHKK